MAQKTETEWQELSDLLARDVMGLIQVESLYGLGKLWDSENGHEYHVALTPCYGTFYKVWQPHNDVAQALAVLDRIAETYHYGHSIFLLASHLTHYRVLIWKGFGCVGMWQGEHTSRAKAICLAIEKFMGESC